MKQHCGRIALLGRPNAGKSTLVNALIGDKVAAVARRPQTTRHRVVGVKTRDHHQLVYLDSPGLHREVVNQLNRSMNRAAWSVAHEADVLCYLVDVVRGWHSTHDADFLKEITCERPDATLRILATQTDRLPKKQVLQKAEIIQERALEIAPHLELLTLSSKVPAHLVEFEDHLMQLLPERAWDYASDLWTPSSQRFLVSELIREQAFRQLGEELPYGLTITIDAWHEEPSGVEIHATIVTARASHKPMIIGARGQRIREIGRAARENIKAMLENRPVFLDLHVRVVNDWMRQQSTIDDLSASGLF